MSFTEFERSLLADSSPPASLSLPLRALWLDAKGDWNDAHRFAQKAGEDNPGTSDSRNGAWVHAYLHRKEGDEGNAAYWYARAGRPVATGDFKVEWAAMVSELLKTG